MMQQTNKQTVGISDEQVFNNLLADEDWYTQHHGKFVAIVRGQVCGIDSDFVQLAKMVAENYPEDEKFIAEVRKEDGPVVCDLPIEIVDDFT